MRRIAAVDAASAIQNDFIVIEIASAFAQNIFGVIPVLVSGANMPKVNELTNPIQSLVHCNSTEISTSQFDRDAEELIRIIRDPLKRGSVNRHQKRNRVTVGVSALVFLFLIGGGYAFLRQSSKEQVSGAEPKWEDERKALESTANSKVRKLSSNVLQPLRPRSRNASRRRQSRRLTLTDRQFWRETRLTRLVALIKPS